MRNTHVADMESDPGCLTHAVHNSPEPTTCMLPVSFASETVLVLLSAQGHEETNGAATCSVTGSHAMSHLRTWPGTINGPPIRTGMLSFGI